MSRIVVERVPSSDVRTFAVWDAGGAFAGTVGYRRHDKKLVRHAHGHTPYLETIRRACQLADEQIQLEQGPDAEGDEVMFAYDSRRMEVERCQ